jgi:acyl-CoA synthetase (AMP-forming)/AMP-acid ligase II
MLGTAFSFVHLLDFLAEQDLRFQLPAGSQVMETGGYKNRSRSLPKAELHQLITERLGVPPSHIICEYGMSELSSQAYDRVAGDGWRVTDKDSTPRHSTLVTRHFLFPPWVRLQIVSPETGYEVAEGETGLIRVFDLANVFSVMAIQTEDLGIRRAEHFELIGRAALAEPRGCSLMVAETRKS